MENRGLKELGLDFSQPFLYLTASCSIFQVISITLTEKQQKIVCACHLFFQVEVKEARKRSAGYF
jgi:hypothetical protein